MTSVILHSSSIHNTFISTVDHLPCDVIRSLWLIQSCNISIDKNKQKIHELFYSLQHNTSNEETLDQIKLTRSKLQQLIAEALAESRALHNQLITHKITLDNEVQQLKDMSNKSYDLNKANDDSNEELRKQLIAHYKENPLISQKEALEEQETQGMNNDDSKLKLNTNGKNKTGIKLVLRLTNNKTKKSNSKLKVGDKRFKPKKVINQPIPSFQPSEPIIDDNDNTDNNPYCFCNQPSLGDMIACDNEESCPNGEWFHYKCVGLLNRVEALKYTTGKQKWFCSDFCRLAYESNQANTNTKSKSKLKGRKRKRKRSGY